MNISEIISFLDDNGVCETEEIRTEEDATLIKFYYDFDNDEIVAARSYADEESDYESESDEWYSEYYVPYLKDVAEDNVESIIEDLMEEYEVECKFKSIGMENGNTEYFEFVAAICDELSECDLEEILNDYFE